MFWDNKIHITVVEHVVSNAGMTLKLGQGRRQLCKQAGLKAVDFVPLNMSSDKMPMLRFSVA